MRLKKIMTVLLTLAMVVSLLPATAYAANNTATTMRLEKTQGTVNITNSTGKAVTQTDKMKLYNGYKVKTGAKSYAWISLDDTKVAKLDANSVMEVQKSGKNLTLYLSSGSMFFNVKDPLPKGENFHIRTSTMTTGIRGTSGCVRVISDRVTEVHLLTGQVEIFAAHPGLGLSKHAVLMAGQKATSLIDWEAMQKSGEMVDIIIEPLLNHEVCGNCAKEIAADAALRERIEREAPHLLPEQIAGSADERLAADEAAAEAKQAIIDEAVAKQEFPEEVDPYFEATSGGGGGGGGGSSAVSKIVNVANWADLLQAIDDYNRGSGTTQINLTNSIDARNEQVPLPAIANKGDLTLHLGANTLTLNDTLVNNSNLTITNVDGYIYGSGNAAAVQNNGLLTLLDGQINGRGATALVNNGTFTMKGGELVAVPGNGTAAPSALQLNGGMTIFEGGTILAEGNAIAVQASSEGYFESKITTTICAAERTAVFIVADQGLPTGYMVKESGTYFVLSAAEGGGETTDPVDPPAGDPDTPAEDPNAITTWEDFVDAVIAFNEGNSSETITLGATIPTSLEFETYGVDIPALPTIGNGNSSTLTIDLATYGLELPMPLSTATSSGLNITGTTGYITKGAVWTADSTDLIESYTTMQLSGGEIRVPDGYVGIRTWSEFTMLGGSITTSGSGKGIYMSGGRAELNGGTITLGSDATADGAGVTPEAGTLIMGGTAITANGSGTGIYALANGAQLNLNSGSVIANSSATAVYNNSTTVNMNLSSGEAITIKAADKNKVFVVTQNITIPSGYAVSTEAIDGYYVLVKETQVTQNAFIQTINDFDGSAPTTVKLTEATAITEETLATALPLANPLPTKLVSAPEGSEMLIIDLAGKNLTLNTSLVNNGKMMIMDSVGGGTINGSAAEMIVNNGELTLDQFAVTPTAQAVVNSGTLVVDGTTFNTRANGTSGIVNTGTTTIEAGTFYANNGDSSGQAINSSSGTLTMNGGSIASEGRYDSIKVSGGTFNMTGGSITTKAYMAAAISLSGSAKANISGGTITADDNGGEERGIYVANGATLNMTGGTINVETLSGNNSGGILAAANSTVNISGGIINATTAGGYALRVFNSTNTDWSSINLTVDVDNATVQAMAADYVISPDTHPDYKGYEVLDASGAGTGVYKLGIRNGVGTAQELYDAIQAFNAGTTSDSITLTADIDFADEPNVPALTVNNTNNNAVLTLNLGDHDLNLTNTMTTNSHVTLEGTGTITATGDIITNAQVTGSNIIPELTLNGPELSVTSGWAVNSSSLVFLDAGKITIAENASGGINAINSQTTINGGTITNNSRGSAVAGGTVTMNGGRIDVYGGYGITSVTETFVEEDGSKTQIANIALNSGTITVNGGTGVYLSPGMAGLEGVNITVTRGIGVQNSDTGIVVMGDTTISVGEFSSGVIGGTLHMYDDNSVINVDGMGGVGVEVNDLEMTGGNINANAQNTTAIYAEGNKVIKVLTGTGAYPAVTAEFYDENSGSTAMAITAKPDNNSVYPTITLEGDQHLIFARAAAGLINDDFLAASSSDFVVYSPTDIGGEYYTLVLRAN